MIGSERNFLYVVNIYKTVPYIFLLHCLSNDFLLFYLVAIGELLMLIKKLNRVRSYFSLNTSIEFSYFFITLKLQKIRQIVCIILIHVDQVEAIVSLYVQLQNVLK